MKIAIVGSREGFTDEFVTLRLNQFFDSSNPTKNTFITGGARGVDKMAEEYAKILKIPLEIIRPINPASKIDYLFRNVEIVTKADLVVAFWDEKSRGTKFVIDYAKARGKEVKIIKLGDVI